MTITISASGIALDGPLVAGEKVAVSVSGLALAAEDKPTLALLARFPDALLSSVELAEDAQTPGTWTGELDTATKQTALFFATARADERRDAALELVAGRVSIARLTVPMANSALCPKPDGSPFASPVYIPVPGPPGQGGDPYDQAPEMDGEASAGVSDEYARGDHRHPTDTSRMAATAMGVDIKAGGDVGNISITAALTQLDEDLGGKQDTIADLAAIRSGAAAGATAVQPSALSAYRTAAAQDAIDGGKMSSTATGADIKAGGDVGNISITAALTQLDEDLGAKQDTIADLAAIRSGAAAGATAVQPGALAAYRTATAQDAIDGAQDAAIVAIADKAADAASLAPAFSTSSTYAVGDYVTHEGILYKCTTAVSTAGAWNAANWTAAAVTDEMGGGGAPNHKIWAANPDSSSTQSVLKLTPFGDDFAVEEGVVVVFRSNVTNAAGVKINVGGTGDNTVYDKGLVYGGTSLAAGAIQQGCVYAVSYWAQGNGIWVLEGTTYASIASPTFTGTPKAPTAAVSTGNTQVATTAFVHAVVNMEARYALTAKTPSVSGTSATVACEDRAINDFTVATGITSLTITPPAAVTGRARDFFCRVTLTDSSLPTVTLSGGTIDIGATEVAGMTQGVNLLMFTEISSGHWLASRRSAS